MKMKLVSVIAVLTAVLCGQASVAHAQDWRKDAEGRDVDCSLTVKGKTYLSGTCKYDADEDGSFRLFGDKYFLYLTTFEGGKAGVSWNGTSQASHAQELLGEDFKRDGACWVGKQAKVCAWDKKSAPAKTSQAKPETIKFAKGAFSTIVTGKLNDFAGENQYVIEVGKGQSMIVEQVDAEDNRISLYVTDPKGNAANDMDLSCHSEADISPTKAGKYTIKVVECQKADPWKGSYSFKVTVK